MTTFWWVVLGIVVLGTVVSAPAGWALSSGGYCIDEYIPGRAAFEVPPYVQQVTDSSALVRWHTDIDTDGTLDYGETKALGQRTTGGSGQWHLATLRDLKPNTHYYYRIGSGAIVQSQSKGSAPLAATEMQSFHTYPGATGTITFGVIGDSGTGDATQATMAQVLTNLKPNLVLHTGDVVYPRGADCFYQSRFYQPYQNLISAVPFYPTLGNHDLKSQQGKAYFTTFALPANNPEQSERFYSFDAGSVHFVSLDSELYHGDGDVTAQQQKSWLEHDLASTKQPWKVVYLHRPLYSSGEHGGDSTIRDDLAPVFAKYHVNVVFAGHDHDYERFHPIDGVTYIVTGGGGQELYHVGHSEQTAYAASIHNVVKVTSSPTSMLIQAVNEQGQVVDHVELTR